MVAKLHNEVDKVLADNQSPWIIPAVEKLQPGERMKRHLKESGNPIAKIFALASFSYRYIQDIATYGYNHRKRTGYKIFYKNEAKVNNSMVIPSLHRTKIETAQQILSFIRTSNFKLYTKFTENLFTEKYGNRKLKTINTNHNLDLVQNNVLERDEVVVAAFLSQKNFTDAQFKADISTLEKLCADNGRGDIFAGLNGLEKNHPSLLIRKLVANNKLTDLARLIREHEGDRIGNVALAQCYQFISEHSASFRSVNNKLSPQQLMLADLQKIFFDDFCNLPEKRLRKDLYEFIDKSSDFDDQDKHKFYLSLLHAKYQEKYPDEYFLLETIRRFASEDQYDNLMQTYGLSKDTNLQEYFFENGNTFNAEQIERTFVTVNAASTPRDQLAKLIDSIHFGLDEIQSPQAKIYQESGIRKKSGFNLDPDISSTHDPEREIKAVKDLIRPLLFSGALDKPASAEQTVNIQDYQEKFRQLNKQSGSSGDAPSVLDYLEGSAINPFSEIKGWSHSPRIKRVGKLLKKYFGDNASPLEAMFAENERNIEQAFDQSVYLDQIDFKIKKSDGTEARCCLRSFGTTQAQIDTFLDKFFFKAYEATDSGIVSRNLSDQQINKLMSDFFAWAAEEDLLDYSIVENIELDCNLAGVSCHGFTWQNIKSTSNLDIIGVDGEIDGLACDGGAIQGIMDGVHWKNYIHCYGATLLGAKIRDQKIDQGTDIIFTKDTSDDSDEDISYDTAQKYGQIKLQGLHRILRSMILRDTFRHKIKNHGLRTDIRYIDWGEESVFLEMTAGLGKWENNPLKSPLFNKASVAMMPEKYQPFFNAAFGPGGINTGPSCYTVTDHKYQHLVSNEPSIAYDDGTTLVKVFPESGMIMVSLSDEEEGGLHKENIRVKMFKIDYDDPITEDDFTLVEVGLPYWVRTKSHLLRDVRRAPDWHEKELKQRKKSKLKGLLGPLRDGSPVNNWNQYYTKMFLNYMKTPVNPRIKLDQDGNYPVGTEMIMEETTHTIDRHNVHGQQNVRRV